jgi:hypothetical protein
MKTVDVVAPFSSKNVEFEGEIRAAIESRPGDTTKWPCESALEKLSFLLEH